jgi:hypothetical protein
LFLLEGELDAFPAKCPNRIGEKVLPQLLVAVETLFQIAQINHHSLQLAVLEPWHALAFDANGEERTTATILGRAGGLDAPQGPSADLSPTRLCLVFHGLSSLGLDVLQMDVRLWRRAASRFRAEASITRE